MRELRDRSFSVALLLLVVGGAGCQSDPPMASNAAVLVNAAPAGSPMARVSLGMMKDAVADAIGEPTQSGSHLTGKNLNPLYWGVDRYRTIWYYAGQGRLTFNMGAKLILIEYDPGEPGRPPA